MRTVRHSLLALLVCTGTHASAQDGDFNRYVLAAIDDIYPKYAHGGYDMAKVYTHDIDYGDPGAIPKSSPLPPAAPSMCVATMAEVIATAIHLYYLDHKNARATSTTAPRATDDVIGRVPADQFRRSSRMTLRGNIFMLEGTGSRGTAFTLSRFGLGEELPFDRLKPGDFVNFNRSTHTGHAVVFLGYLDRAGNPLTTYSDQVAGFKYFSDQGKGRPDAGLGYRWAFFGDRCPDLPAGQIRDCKVIRSANPALLNSGRMFAPSQWTFETALPKLRIEAARGIAGSRGISREAADSLLDDPLDESTLSPGLNGEDVG